jgi:hypothetical protein
MSQVPHELITAIGAVVAALIAGAVAYLGLIISKESKVSEFRQQWIDSLREDVSGVIAHVDGIRGSSIWATFGRTVPNSSETLWDKVKDDITGLRQKSARIRLRLNPNEKRKKEKEANKAIVDLLKQYHEIFERPTLDFSELDAINERLISATQTVLKENWNRVRHGEFVYRLAKGFAFLIIICGVVGIVLLFFVGHISSPSELYRLHP